MFFKNAHYLVSDSGSALNNAESLEEYLRLAGEARKRFGLKLPAYALLPGRALLYFVTPGADLHAVMGSFAKSGNLPGYVAGHCKYKLIQPEKYAAHLARFIHLEPVKAGLAASPEEYRWSSAAQYLGAAGPADKEAALDFLDAEPAAALAKYKTLMAEPVPGKFWRPFDKNRDAVLGDRDFLAAHSPHLRD